MIKKPKLKRDWKDLKVKSLVMLVNRLASMPAGTVYMVLKNYNGLSLKSNYTVLKIKKANLIRKRKRNNL